MMYSVQHFHTLVDVAMGREPADLVIRHGQWVCVQSGEIVPNTDIAIKDGRIAYVGEDASHCVSKDTVVIDAADRYLVPGLLDAHMHVESGMVTVTEFVRAVAPRGTTGMFIDPHEIANVFGLKGVRLMVDEAAVQPIHVWVQVPSCVPSAPGLETPGASIGPEDVAEAMTWDGIIGLGEVMNFPGVASGDAKMLAEMAEARKAGKVIGGHYASPDLGLPFHGYVAGGAEDDHEGTRLEDAVARVRQGMKAMLRYGSAWHDVAAQVKAVTKLGLDPRHFILCTDDSHAETLSQQGHMDRVIRHAIHEGLSPMTAIQMATLNTAEHFGLSREVGMIAPGRWADVLLVKDLREFFADLVVAKGRVIAEKGDLLIELPSFDYPEWARRSVHLKRPLQADDFRLHVPEELRGEKRLMANVIGIIENQAPTRHLRLEVPVEGDEVQVDMERDLAKVALVERHHGSGSVTVGLVQGFGFTAPCAVASTVAHDSHHMVVVGTREAEMALAANTLAEVGGGQVVVKDGEVIGLVELTIGGLMSTERAEVVAQKAAAMLDGFRACGCTLNNPNMQLSLLALAVIPELRISDKGLVDVNRFALVPVLETV
ncbi:MAG: adenine deaminase [Anaerolineae bacterium]|nr:MAG: adenine deaminase [Anaerolineae bacterium]